MKKLAFLFPGQGAQYCGMGKDFRDTFPIARQTFEEADDILGESLSSIVFEGPESELTKTKYSQLGIFVVSVALQRALQTQLPACYPAVCAGLSLGEYTALSQSGRLSFRETLLLIRHRANFMNEACEKTAGTMAAVLGLDAEAIDIALQGIPEVWVANYNCPGQIVISGTEEGCAQATAVLKNKGAKRIIPLRVHGAFHSGLMQSAQDALAPFIAEAPLVHTEIGFAMNAIGDFAYDLGEIREHLTRQVTHSVRWEQVIRAIERKNIDLYIEIGCGKVLTGFNKKISVACPSISIETIADLEIAARALEAPAKVCI